MPVLQEDLKNPTSKDFPGSSNSKEPACQCRRHKRCKFNLWVGKILWRRKCNPFQSILAGIIPWTEEPGGLQSMESQRVGHDWAANTHTRVNPTGL